MNLALNTKILFYKPSFTILQKKVKKKIPKIKFKKKKKSGQKKEIKKNKKINNIII